MEETIYLFENVILRSYIFIPHLNLIIGSDQGHLLLRCVNDDNEMQLRAKLRTPMDLSYIINNPDLRRFSTIRRLIIDMFSTHVLRANALQQMDSWDSLDRKCSTYEMYRLETDRIIRIKGVGFMSGYLIMYRVNINRDVINVILTMIYKLLCLKSHMKVVNTY